MVSIEVVTYDLPHDANGDRLDTRKHGEWSNLEQCCIIFHVEKYDQEISLEDD